MFLADMQIFFFGSETASYMSLGLIVIEDFLDFCSKTGIEFLKSFCYIFMYCGFGNSEFSGSASYGSTGFNDVIGQLQNALFYVIFHRVTVHHLILD